jgi:replicative DNA helicase
VSAVSAPGPTLPPQDLDAEQSLLGAMMLSESAVDIATEIVRQNDFYRESHGVVFSAVQSLYGKNSPVDQITVSDELATQGKLDDVGGTPFIYSLADAIPAVANVRRYAEIVHDLAVIRRLIGAGMEIAQLGYERQGSASELVDRAESIVFDVAQDRSQDGLTPIKGLLIEEFARIEKLAESGSDVTGVPSGLKSLDRLLSGFQPSNLVILAARPGMGKTSLALGFARYVGVEANLPVAVFSLEMSRHEVTQRLMCAEALVDSQNLRTGKMRQEDWGRLVAACDRLSRAPIYIDDTAGVNVMEIRSKARRLKSQEKGLALIIVDYLQLMQGAGASESRVQEISHISRSLKLLARDLDMPVMALSQLSRAVESRQDKRPILSDLRESGCVTGDTMVFLAEAGRYERIDELVGREPFDVLAVSTDTWRLERATATRAFATGVKPVYRLRTRLGRTIRATANHRFLTVMGWRRLDELTAGDHVALPRTLPTGGGDVVAPERLALLGHLIGDGCTLPRHVLQYTTREPELAEMVADLARASFGDAVRPRIQVERTWYQVYLPSATHCARGRGNPIATWLRELGAFGLRSHEKRVPDIVFGQSDEGIATFLRHLWATDGCIRSEGVYPTIRYSTSSEQLARGVQSLLLRLDVRARLREVEMKGGAFRPAWWVEVSGRDEVLRFCDRVGAVGTRRRAAVAKIIRRVEELSPNTYRDVVPAAVWRAAVVPAMERAGVTSRALQAALAMSYCGTTLYRANLGRDRAERVATIIRSPEVEALATSDVYWDSVVAIQPDGAEAVYDLTVDELHNFVANDVIVHNSIEQDADVVMFIYRDEYYVKDSETNKGIAELIVAKHRSGATDAVELAFRQKYTLFSDLARGEA